ncbi:hypothetical protein AB5N19_10208 [Seiridium cardinale]
MANVTADLDQLLRLLSSFANNVTEANSGNGDDDSLVSTSNSLAFTALLVSIAAFVIASLQAVLEYMSAGDSVRSKCNSAALGRTSAFVDRRWSWRSWKWKFYYPELRIETNILFGHDRRTPEIVRFFEPLLQKSPHYRWEPIPIYDKDRHPLSSAFYRPRATWAQVLATCDFAHISNIIDGKVDAEYIPTSLDVPSQQMNLAVLGIIALLMDMSVVRINIDRREFFASGSLGTITTEELSGFGKLLRFQKTGVQTTTKFVLVPLIMQEHQKHQLVGALHFGGKFFGNSSSFHYLMNGIELTAGLRDCSIDEGVDSRDHIGRKAELRLLDLWREQAVIRDASVRWPSVLGIAMIANLNVLNYGYPAADFLTPFSSFVKLLADDVRTRRGSTYRVMSNAPNIPVPQEQWEIPEPKTGLCGHIMPEADELLCSSFDLAVWRELYDRAGSESMNLAWLQVCLLDANIQTLLTTLHARAAHDGPVVTAGGNVYVDDSDDEIDGEEVEGQEGNDDGVRNKVAGDQNEDLRGAQKEGSDGGQSSQPDEEAGGQSSDDESTRGPRKIMFSIMQAIWAAWAQDGAETLDRVPFSGLERAIAKELDMLDGEAAGEYGKIIAELADLLKPRAIFYCAYMMLGPDSSDVRKAHISKTQVTLPMI